MLKKFLVCRENTCRKKIVCGNAMKFLHKGKGIHLGHSDTLTLDMIEKSTDMFIAHCDCNNKGVRVALIVNTNLNPKQIRMNTILEIVAVEINEPIQMIVISVYRPPSTPTDVFMNHMLEIIAQFQHVPTCIVGDCNEDVSMKSNTHCCTMFRL